MRRRTILKGILGGMLLPLLGAPQRAAQAQPAQVQGLVYSDSDGNTDLTSLADGNRASGGVVYGA